MNRLITTLGICTDQYISRLKQRIAAGEVMNMGMLLSGHEWGDNLSGVMADTTHFDYLPMFDAKDTIPF